MVKKTSKTTKEETATTAKSQPEQSAPAPGLNLQDMVTVAQIIQLSSTRGAFRAEEMQQVGTLYTKLVTFLQATGALGTPEQQEEEKKNA